MLSYFKPNRKPFNACKLVVVLALLVQTAVAQALPKNIQLQYEVKRDGKLFANVKEQFTQDGKQYNIVSVTKGIGVYALMGERKLTSSGDVTKAGLKPKYFELQQGNQNKKRLINDFDWANNTLNMQIKGEQKTETLTKGTQDLLSYAYQFMFLPPTKTLISKNTIDVKLTTGKKLSLYQYKVLARGVKLQAANTSFKTLHIANMPAAGDDKKQIWLAQISLVEDKLHLPIRYQLTDEDGSFEQTLTYIHVE